MARNGSQWKGAGRLVVLDRYTACHHGGVQPAFEAVLLIAPGFWAGEAVAGRFR